MAAKEARLKRILMIGNSPNKGGVEAYVQNLCAALPAERYEIIHRDRQMRIDGRLWKAPANRHRYLRYRLFWRRFFRENRFDAVYFNTCDMMSIDPLRFAKAAGVAVRIIHSHNSGNQLGLTHLSLFHRLGERRNRRTIDRYATQLLACSRAAGEWMFGGRAFRIIHNGIRVERYVFDREKRLTIRAREGLGNGPVIGIIGRLEPQKNPLFALQIARSVLKMAPEARILFLGDGSLREQLAREIGDAGLGDRIRLTGAVDHVNEWMWAMDCVLMPSLFEGLPFVLVEAQAASLPCVVSANVSGEADLTGLVRYVSLEDTEDIWARQVLEACRIPRTDRSGDVVKAGYSIHDTGREVAGLLDGALDTR